MDAERFDTFARSLTVVGSRRRALVAALGGTLGMLGLAHPDDVTAGGACKPACTECQTCKKGKCHKTKHGKVCKKGTCQPTNESLTCQNNACKACRGGICSNRTDDTTCNGTGKCLTGVCNPKPTCAEKASPCSTTNNLACCSEYCQPADPDLTPGQCFYSGAGKQCYNDASCNSDATGPLTCVGYRCR